MDLQLLIKTAMSAGELMLCSGAETYRVEDTMHHILKTADNLEMSEVLVVMTGITASVKVKGEKVVTLVKRVESRENNLSRVVSVNDISRRYCGGELSLQAAYEELNSLKKKEYRRLSYSIATVAVCVGFSLFFGGGIWEVVSSLIVGAFLAFCIEAVRDLKVHAFIEDVFSSMGIAMASAVMKIMLGGRMDIDIVIISCIMPLVPGMAITNAARDTLRGDYLSGIARMLEAFIKAAGIAIGIGIGLAIMGSY
ncbi:threonine/serine exporter family protein [bacterium]|uniref:threonine/serine ThrE exporter family protein n=1 Tax=Bariatricus sp. HCP28S3_A7 TaxID=3438894 RepID=UPI002A89356D|nr:threonine/serine exporter family protein [bacterium]MDY4503642.1 threonine/serine exporter family protein [Bariatricus sp.]